MLTNDVALATGTLPAGAVVVITPPNVAAPAVVARMTPEVVPSKRILADYTCNVQPAPERGPVARLEIASRRPNDAATGSRGEELLRTLSECGIVVNWIFSKAADGSWSASGYVSTQAVVGDSISDSKICISEKVKAFDLGSFPMGNCA
jgi:hypothetical protein